MIHIFTAIDFETATGVRTSICQVGIVRVENGRTVNTLSRLVQPPNNYYSDWCIDIHGITPDKTENAPTFDKVWNDIASFIQGQHLVAHNGFSFDFVCLKKTLAHYSIKPPSFTGHCTLKIFRRDLHSLCKKHHIPLNHHDALSDALACAELFKIHLKGKKD